MNSPHRIGGIGSTIEFYDISGEYPSIKQGVVLELHTWGIITRTQQKVKHLVAIPLFIRFVKPT
jgi:hypothetical protein